MERSSVNVECLVADQGQKPNEGDVGDVIKAARFVGVIGRMPQSSSDRPAPVRVWVSEIPAPFGGLEREADQIEEPSKALAGDRRPTAARSLRTVMAVADWLVRRHASPNAISAAGAVAACLAGIAIALTREAPAIARPLWLLGAVLVQVRLMANLLDGMVAIGRGVASATGELFNEVPDRVSDTAVLAGLGWASGQLALGLAAALAALATAYVRAIGKGLGQPSDFSGPMAKQQRMALVTALAVACAVLPARWGAEWPGIALWIVTVGASATAGRRLVHVAGALRR